MRFLSANATKLLTVFIFQPMAELRRRTQRHFEQERLKIVPFFKKQKSGNSPFILTSG
jgi:hypothetical protein